MCRKDLAALLIVLEKCIQAEERGGGGDAKEEMRRIIHVGGRCRIIPADPQPVGPLDLEHCVAPYVEVVILLNRFIRREEYGPLMEERAFNRTMQLFILPPLTLDNFRTIEEVKALILFLLKNILAGEVKQRKLPTPHPALADPADCKEPASDTSDRSFSVSDWESDKTDMPRAKVPPPTGKTVKSGGVRNFTRSADQGFGGGEGGEKRDIPRPPRPRAPRGERFDFEPGRNVRHPKSGEELDTDPKAKKVGPDFTPPREIPTTDWIPPSERQMEVPTTDWIPPKAMASSPEESPNLPPPSLRPTKKEEYWIWHQDGGPAAAGAPVTSLVPDEK
ncbi:MAG: hypothetical protein LBB14_00460 [Puniceicoccales bacterium]|nr:hypothetical protein [Puniceicoccales bacterium]